MPDSRLIAHNIAHFQGQYSVFESLNTVNQQLGEQIKTLVDIRNGVRAAADNALDNS